MEGKLCEAFYVVESGSVILTQERYIDGEEYDEEVGRLGIGSCFGEHSLDFIPKQDRKRLISDDRASTNKLLRLASGKVIDSPSKGHDERNNTDSQHIRAHEAPPIWRETVMADPQMPSTVLLWMKRDRFVRIVGHLRDVLQKNEMQRLIDSIPVFRDLKSNQRMRLAQAINRRMVITRMAGQTIYEQGAMDDKILYLIHKGSVTIKKVADDGSIIVLHESLESGSYFGELSFSRDEPREATAVAMGRVELIALSREVVVRVLGSMSVIEESEAARRQYEKRLALADTFSMKDLSVVCTLGAGTFGRVRLVHHKPTGVEYALKSMRKEMLVQLKHTESAVNEKRILAAANHPFVNQLVAVMHDEESSGEVHLMVDLCLGGELWTLLEQAVCFDMSTTTFYAACVVSALVHLHSRRIVYRDLKPENLVLDSSGHVIIIDMGFSKVLSAGVKTYTLCGTPQYLAPEIVTSQGHSFPADRWAVGVLIFEMLVGTAPYDDQTTMGLYKKIIANRLMYPAQVKGCAKDLVMKLLQSSPLKRLGSGATGTQELADDIFFINYDFDLLERKQ